MSRYIFIPKPVNDIIPILAPKKRPANLPAQELNRSGLAIGADGVADFGEQNFFL